MVKVIEDGLFKFCIEEVVVCKQACIDSGKDQIVGVNVFCLDVEDFIDILEVDNIVVWEF